VHNPVEHSLRQWPFPKLPRDVTDRKAVLHRPSVIAIRSPPVVNRPSVIAIRSPSVVNRPTSIIGRSPSVVNRKTVIIGRSAPVVNRRRIEIVKRVRKLYFRRLLPVAVLPMHCPLRKMRRCPTRVDPFCHFVFLTDKSGHFTDVVAGRARVWRESRFQICVRASIANPFHH
jgi:hypothetical protein